MLANIGGKEEGEGARKVQGTLTGKERGGELFLLRIRRGCGAVKLVPSRVRGVEL